MALADRFGFFDPRQPYSVTFGELPHWEQEGATYFITFRTGDSLPQSVSKLLRRQRDDWLLRHGINPARGDWQAALRQQPHQFQRQFHRDYATKLEAALDEGQGDCMLRDPKLAQLVADSLLHFDGEHVAELRSRGRVAPRLGAELRSNSATTGSSATSSDSTTIPEVRYHVSDFVVMPNHAHVMVCFLPGIGLLAQC